jgi:hypothetical protein
MDFKAELTEFIEELDDYIKTEMMDGGYPREIDDSSFIFECEEQYGGEGMGESYWGVWKISRQNDIAYVKFDGSYYSYQGSTFDSWFFVEPQQVLVTQYVKL